MTALEKFIRLEALGLWRESPLAEPREVVVSFGNATLMLRDIKDFPLGHWSLLATRVVDRSETGALYSVDPDGAETLEINDFEMIHAIETVSSAQIPKQNRRRLLPKWVYILFVFGLVSATVWWGPNLLRRYAANSIPLSQSETIGQDVLAQLIAQQGPGCFGAAAMPALGRFMQRLFADDKTWRLQVMPLNGRPTASLPGGQLLVDSTLLATLNEPDELAGYLALEAARASGGAPLAALLHDTSLGVTFRLMLRGNLDEAAAETTAKGILQDPGLPAGRNDVAALDILRAAQVSAKPFSSALTRAGTDYARATVFDTDPTTTTRPVLDDQDWVALQDICAK